MKWIGAFVLAVGCGSAAEQGAATRAEEDSGASVEDTTTPDAREDETTDASADSVVEGEGIPKCPTPPIADPMADHRAACKFDKGARVDATLGLTNAERAAIPIKHLIVVMNENRSFDHYFGHLATEGQPDAEALPATFVNKDASGATVKPFHLTSTCLERDPPHGWDPMHKKWNGGKMDGFVTASDVSGSNGHYAMGYYTAADLPFYNFLAKTWAISDRYFSSVMGPTWPNRDYFYAATSDGVINTFERKITVRTIFDALDTAKVSWAQYGDGGSRADCVNQTAADPHHHSFAEFLVDASSGTLPAFSVLDPSGGQDEHPAGDVQTGEQWARKIYEAVRKSPNWPSTALLYTYDEAGGLFDHVPPPKACIPSPTETGFDRLGFRVPLIVVSPWARPHFVSHRTHEHTSITRLVELLHDLPALTARDANADALLDLFDFNCPTMLDAPVAPVAGKGGCP